MMEFFQSIVRSFLGKVILGILCLGMAMWGFGDSFGGASDSDIARAGKHTFSMSDLNIIVDQQQRIMSQNDQYVSKAALVENGMIDEIFDVFSSQTATLGYGQQFGIFATEDQIWEEIQSEARFQDVTGEFSLDAYKNFVNQGLGLSITGFERRIRDEKSINYISGALNGLRTNTSTFDAIEFAYNNEVRHVSWLRLPFDASTAGNAPPSDAVLRDYYASNSARYFRDETRDIDVMHVSTQDYLHKVNPIDAELVVFYETVRETAFALPTARSFDEILFQTQDQAKASVGVLGAGGAAADLVGFLGVNARTAFESDITEPELKDIFSPYAQESQILGVREIDGKWAVTRITDIPPTDTQPFEDVRDQVLSLYRQQQALSHLFEVLEGVDIDIAGGATLAELAQSLGAPIISLGATTSQGNDLDGNTNTLLQLNPEALEQVFVLDTGEYTDLFEVGEIDPSAGGQPRGAIIMEVSRVTPGHLPPYDDIADIVLADFTKAANEKALETFKSDTLLSLVSGTKGFQETADMHGADIEMSGQDGLKRLDTYTVALPREAQRAIFELDANVFTAFVDAATNDVVILKVDEILPARRDPLSVEIQPSQAMIQSATERDIRNAFNADIRDASGLSVNYQYLNAYKRQTRSDGDG